jgi:hypothetical protein
MEDKGMGHADSKTAIKRRIKADSKNSIIVERKIGLKLS